MAAGPKAIACDLNPVFNYHKIRVQLLEADKPRNDSPGPREKRRPRCREWKQGRTGTKRTTRRASADSTPPGPGARWPSGLVVRCPRRGARPPTRRLPLAPARSAPKLSVSLPHGLTSTMRAHWVPLPAPGPPKTNTTNGFMRWRGQSRSPRVSGGQVWTRTCRSWRRQLLSIQRAYDSGRRGGAGGAGQGGGGLSGRRAPPPAAGRRYRKGRGFPARRPLPPSVPVLPNPVWKLKVFRCQNLGPCLARRCFSSPDFPFPREATELNRQTQEPIGATAQLGRKPRENKNCLVVVCREGL